ncbi:hypothetical protein HTQ63_20825, partial [Yersinia pestis subsp. pestis]
ERQQQVAAIILKDPAVESLTSFVGVDGTNATLNNGRLQINLKPHSFMRICPISWLSYKIYIPRLQRRLKH